ncbi:MAG: FeoA family protein [Pseudoflavonifractor sp.]
MMHCSLCALPVGASGAVTAVTAEPALRCRLQDLGLIAGTRVTCLFRSPAGDPSAYRIRGAVIALRGRDAATVALVPCPPHTDP